MTSDIIQDLYRIVNKYENKDEIIAALKAIQAALEHELLVEQTNAYQQMLAREMMEGGNNH